jgi:hypothetical protein
LSKIIDLHKEVLNFAQKEGERLGAVWSRYNQLALSGPQLSIPDAMFIQHFVHGLGTESTEYLDMTYEGSWKEGESLGAARCRYNQLALSTLDLFILDAMFIQYFVHGMDTESTEYLDMTSGGVFVHYMIE